MTARRVALQDILENPQSFHGQRISAVGYLFLKFEENSIYAVAQNFGNPRLALWVSTACPHTQMSFRPFENREDELFDGTFSLNHTYVLIEGLIDSLDKGHFGLWAGTITNITRCEATTEKS